jgi:hypothetical protein
MNISDVGFFKVKLGSQTFFDVPPQIVIAHRQIPLGVLLAYKKIMQNPPTLFT